MKLIWMNLYPDRPLPLDRGQSRDVRIGHREGADLGLLAARNEVTQLLRAAGHLEAVHVARCLLGERIGERVGVRVVVGEAVDPALSRRGHVDPAEDVAAYDLTSGIEVVSPTLPVVLEVRRLTQD